MSALQFFSFLFLLIGLQTTQAHVVGNSGLKPVLADLKTLKANNIPVLSADEYTGVGFTYLTPEAEETIHRNSHFLGRCGAFESLENQTDFSIQNIENLFSTLRTQKQKEELYLKGPLRLVTRNFDQKIQDAINQADIKEIENWVNWFSAFPTRFNKGKDANTHVMALKEKLDTLVKNSALPITVSLIDHKSTPQKSIRVSIRGKTRPDEIIVLGGHFDSINQWGGGSASAPGADDNASGSSNVLEALRVIMTKPQAERTLEFFLYAGEESGLLGSAEIAQSYKKENKNVIAVLQLDMTLFPGEGEFVIGNVEDFTSAWLRDYFVSVNDLYLKVRLVPDECGYGCSDHASWYRQGYSTLLPFEATTNTMNKKIHTASDVVNNQSNFRHSLVFAKLAIIFALDLANSDLRPPTR